MKRRTISLALAFCLCHYVVVGQCDGDPKTERRWDFDERESKGFNILSLLGNVVTPQLIRDTREIRKYVRDPRFKELTLLCGDMRAVDAIYLKALKITEYSIGRALFLSMMATLEHQRIEVKTPLLGVIPLPLTFEEDSVFLLRRHNLPSRLYPDSPRTEHGDRDKLQHFFGSAYLAYITESPEATRSAGNLIEVAEAEFVVGGANDPRDRRANRQGETFGHDLIYVKTLLPSDYFSLPVDESE
jgi:hypothetical protein